MYTNKKFSMRKHPMLALLGLSVMVLHYKNVMLYCLHICQNMQNLKPEFAVFMTVAVIAVIAILMGYLAKNLWEGLLDYSKEIYCACVLIAKVICAIMRKLAIIVGVAVMRTYYSVRRAFRKARRAYRGWKKERETERYLSKIKV